MRSATLLASGITGMASETVARDLSCRCYYFTIAILGKMHAIISQLAQVAI